MTQAVPTATSGRKSLLPRLTIAAIALAVTLTIVLLIVLHARTTYHLATVKPGVLYRDGLRSPEQFAATLDKVHPRTVVSLISDAELADPRKPQLRAEQPLCAARGIKLVRIPVKLGGWPTSDDLQRFLNIVHDKQNQPVLVHCAQGVRRTGFFVAAYQETLQDYTIMKADEAILPFGHSGTVVTQIKAFIESYDPVTRTVGKVVVAGEE